MSNSEPIVRQEPLHGLPQFCVNLTEALKRIIPDEGRRRAVALTSLSGECVLCGLPVSGEQLLEVGARESEAADAKIARLRQGYCARNGCDSRFYRLTFSPFPNLDWTQAFAQSAVVQEEQQDQAQTEAAEVRIIKRVRHWKLAARVGIGLVVLCALYLIRQWYVGGTIPLLREPEKFRTDPASLQPRPPQ